MNSKHITPHDEINKHHLVEENNNNNNSLYTKYLKNISHVNSLPHNEQLISYQHDPFEQCILQEYLTMSRKPNYLKRLFATKELERVADRVLKADRDYQKDIIPHHLEYDEVRIQRKAVRSTRFMVNELLSSINVEVYQRVMATAGPNVRTKD
eukprot:UN09712